MQLYRAQNILGNQYSRIYNPSTHETKDILGAALKFEDDFLNTAIMTAAAGVVGWTAKDTSAAGDTTPGIVANQSGGIAELKHDNQDEEQESGLYFGDALNFNLDKGLIIEFRLAAKVLPTLLTEMYFGLANAYVKGTLAAADQGPTIHGVFMLDGSGAVTIHTDDTSNDNDAVATGITVIAEAQHIFRIDALAPASLKFYIDGVRVATSTTFDMSTGANVVLQPYLMGYKSAGAGLGTLYIDYVRAWQLSR